MIETIVKSSGRAPGQQLSARLPRHKGGEAGPGLHDGAQDERFPLALKHSSDEPT